MMVPLAGDLMAPVGDLPNQFRCGIGDPAENEKCSACTTFVEEVQGTPGAGLQTHLEPVPPVLADDGPERADVEVVFQCNREHVGTGRTGRGRCP